MTSKSIREIKQMQHVACFKKLETKVAGLVSTIYSIYVLTTSLD